MTLEQIKAEAKKKLGREITDAEAQAWLSAHSGGELRDGELEDVSGGVSGVGGIYTGYNPGASPLPPPRPDRR